MARLMCVLVIVFFSPAHGADLRVIDGDTLELAGDRVRLHGIDAPEMKQYCGDVNCGAASRAALINIIDGRAVRCVEVAKRDRYGRMIAKCYVGELELNDWLVRHGHAVAYLKYSHDYVAAEEEARTKYRGLWRSEFVLPERWRRIN